jgi:two-component system response regulator YesN
MCGEAHVMPLRSILIVDNEENQRFIVEQALRALACDWLIVTAASAQEALETLARSTPDLIITDYHMPTMNGLELITQVRNRKLGSRIILITAYSSPELHAAAQRLNDDHYLTKPVTITNLRRLAALALEDSYPSDAAA